MDGRSDVYPSAEGFARKLFYRHDEIEFGIPYEVHRECVKELEAMLQEKDYVTIIEVRSRPTNRTGSSAPAPGGGQTSTLLSSSTRRKAGPGVQ
jgi:L-gulono-1,4-lactone dehydrogenase